LLALRKEAIPVHTVLYVVYAMHFDVFFPKNPGTTVQVEKSVKGSRIRNP
jgi:hypothetical protein